MDDDSPAVPWGPYAPARPRRRLRPLGCLALLVILAVAGAADVFLPNPWAFHIGGQFTPDRSWHGVGTIDASNGGRYALCVGFKAELNSTDFTAALTKQGAIRSSRSTADDGTARTTLRPGSEDEFNHACLAL